jgi:26S proteasome regulatory subunit N5
LRLALDHNEIARLREFMLMLIKRRGQAKKPIIDMIQWAMSEQVMQKLPPVREERYKMLESLKEASDGKMFLEREYSQVVRWIAEMLEADGKHDEATKLIQEIQIETYGSLQTKEKVDFILYQMKLVLGRRDFVRCQILSRKISKKHLSEKGLESAKVQYYRFMVQYYVHERMTLDTAKAYQIIYDTFAANPEELDPAGNERAVAFKNFMIYLLLSAYSNEKVDLLNIVAAKYTRELDD